MIWQDLESLRKYAVTVVAYFHIPANVCGKKIHWSWYSIASVEQNTGKRVSMLFNLEYGSLVSSVCSLTSSEKRHLCICISVKTSSLYTLDTETSQQLLLFLILFQAWSGFYYLQEFKILFLITYMCVRLEAMCTCVHGSC